MKSKFAIFGLEKITSSDPTDEKSGQPYLFRKYPELYETYAKAQKELEQILGNKSPFPRYNFNKYVIFEIFSHEH